MTQPPEENDAEGRVAEGRTSFSEQRVHRDRDLDMGDVPEEEGVSRAEAEEQLDDDPKEEPNYTDRDSED